MSNPVDRTKDGECSQCGRCCSAVLCVSDAEVSKIKHYLGQHPEVKMIDRNNALQKDFIDICPLIDLTENSVFYCVPALFCSFDTPTIKNPRKRVSVCEDDNSIVNR